MKGCDDCRTASHLALDKEPSGADLEEYAAICEKVGLAGRDLKQKSCYSLSSAGHHLAVKMRTYKYSLDVPQHAQPSSLNDDCPRGPSLFAPKVQNEQRIEVSVEWRSSTIARTYLSTSPANTQRLLEPAMSSLMTYS
jgi:hypothetical protein